VLVTVRREGRSMIYTAQYDTMNALLGYLTDNCCKGAPDTCAPATCKPARLKRAKVSVS
jgi:ArsR family transcriptional regulator, arsenate/arsenite/antimonite-responsive transcriptional repressor